MKIVKPFGALIDTYSRRILLFSGAGRKERAVLAKLEELAIKLRELAPGNEFFVHQNAEYVAITTPMHSDAMRSLFREAALACGCELR